MKKIFCCTLALAGVLLTGCRQTRSTAEIPAVRNFDAARYSGRWYEIARLPHWFERDITDAEAEYTLLPDGTFRVVNSGWQNGAVKETQGVAELKTPGIGELSVQFNWFAKGVYRIIWLDEEYHTALVTTDSKAYVWILSRGKEMPPDKLHEALKRLDTWGYEVKLLQYPNGQRVALP